MTGKEGKSQTLDPLPGGKFLMAITDCDIEQIKPGGQAKKENVGKPMFAIELTVQDGDFENRKAWTRVMLFDGALYTISQMLKAQGVAVTEMGDKAEFQVEGYAKNVIPGAAWWMGKLFVVRLKFVAKSKGKDGKEYDDRNEVKGFQSPKDWKPGTSPKKASATTSVGQSLLP
jgi:hypothetical protein